MGWSMLLESPWLHAAESEMQQILNQLIFGQTLCKMSCVCCLAHA